VADFGAGQTIMIDTGESLETAVIGTVGMAGATTVGATVIPVASGAGFTAGQTIWQLDLSGRLQNGRPERSPVMPCF
jgi:hypothetical protein